MNDAVSALNGSPSETFDHDIKKTSIDEAWERIRMAKKDGDIVTGATRNCGDHWKTSSVGIACSHAYSVLKTWELKDKTGKMVDRLLWVRNPWGRETYTGPWSDKDEENWTTEYK